MPLRLEIISEHREQLADRARIVLGEASCNIGRALDNDWALPDQLRFLSAHHACIHFRGGEYFLEDTSSNGTYVNDAVAPLGRRGTQALLHTGDVLRMGDYRILVQIVEAAALPAAPDARTQAAMTVETVVPLRESPGRQPSDIDFSALARSPANGAAGQARARQPAEKDLGDALNLDALLSPGSAMGEQQVAARQRDAARARLENSSSVPVLDAGALAAFCRGAGIDAGRLPVQDEAQVMQVAGRMLREALLGLKEILRAQQAFQDRNSIECTPPEGPSPLDTSMDEYLVEMLTGHLRRKLDAVMQLRDQFQHAAGHAAAIDPALRGALEQYLGHLAPERLATGQDDARNWKRYQDVFRNLLQAGDSKLPHLFLEAFAQAYTKARGKGDE